MHRQRESDSKSAVEDANAKFYSAFGNRDLKVLLHLIHAIAHAEGSEGGLRAAEAPAECC